MKLDASLSVEDLREKTNKITANIGKGELSASFGGPKSNRHTSPNEPKPKQANFQ